MVVKFRPEVRLPYSSKAQATITEQEGRRWARLETQNPGLRLRPYFSTIGQSKIRKLSSRTGAAAPVNSNFESYFVLECPNAQSVGRVAAEIADWPNVETAYVEAGPVPPPVNPSDDLRSMSQGYLDSAPAGIDARWAWLHADGTGARFVDLERGWTLDHEDLYSAKILVISGLSKDFHGHGTAVLGEVAAFDNKLGGIGIAPGAHTRVVSQWRTASIYNTAEAILSAASAMQPGDVLLLEAQTSYPTASGFVPVEVELAVYDAIRFATAQSIVVVEAGANGAVDLDAFEDTNGKKILNRGSADFRDSGAIVVGAASSTMPHQRLGFSNFGSRIDCFAWGENIDTCGDGWMGTATNNYIAVFGGTSGASPIIAGAALLLQSLRAVSSSVKYSPSELRKLLSDVALNTKSAIPAADRIGVMPNLRALIAHETVTS
ncbi:MAG: S8 family serine peptidase [Verrucomicrobia subdivision 3 bacterium]|nr:S8 family serine peptidase [Limisphaerales bacterium]